MLPDFPATKLELLRRLQSAIQDGASDDALLRDIPRFTMMEGERVRYTREDGAERTLTPDKLMSAQAEVPTDSIRKGGLEAMRHVARSMAEQIGEQMAASVIAEVNAATEETGNIYDNKGRPLDPDAILGALGKMELSFMEDGTWDPPTFVLGEGMAEKARLTFERLNSEPEYRDQLEKIVTTAREKWRVREAGRTLVD